MRRLMLVRHASTAATRRAAFPADEPLDDGGRAAAAQLAGTFPSRYEFLSSPAARARETCDAAGLTARIDPALAECDFGDWSGSSLADVHAHDPDGVAAWMCDPDACPHRGETLTRFAARVACWLDDQVGREGTAVAITHGGVVKAAVVHALGAPLAAFWQIDVAPLGVAELHAHGGRWTLTELRTATVAQSRRREASA